MFVVAAGASGAIAGMKAIFAGWLAPAAPTGASAVPASKSAPSKSVSVDLSSPAQHSAKNSTTPAKTQGQPGLPGNRQTGTVSSHRAGETSPAAAAPPASHALTPDLQDLFYHGTLPQQAMIRVPPQSQMPQLLNGCEVTSLSMLLTAVGHPVDKMTLANEQPKDPTPLKMNAHKQIISWGNPNVGFVGSVTDYGYGIYHGPIVRLINQILPGRGVDLTGKPFQDILSVVANGTPVELWATATFKPTNDWVTWSSPEGPVKATWEEHAVLLVGYNQTQLFVNNPLNGEQAQPVSKQEFLEAWRQLGEQAVTIAPAPGQHKP